MDLARLRAMIWWDHCIWNTCMILYTIFLYMYITGRACRQSDKARYMLLKTKSSNIKTMEPILLPSLPYRSRSLFLSCNTKSKEIFHIHCSPSYVEPGICESLVTGMLPRVHYLSLPNSCYMLCVPHWKHSRDWCQVEPEEYYAASSGPLFV